MIHEFWAFICIVGFWGWVLTTVGFILKAFPTRAVFYPRRAALWGSGVVIFFLLWIVGMINA